MNWYLVMMIFIKISGLKQFVKEMAPLMIFCKAIVPSMGGHY